MVFLKTNQKFLGIGESESKVGNCVNSKKQEARRREYLVREIEAMEDEDRRAQHRRVEENNRAIEKHQQLCWRDVETERIETWMREPEQDEWERVNVEDTEKDTEEKKSQKNRATVPACRELLLRLCLFLRHYIL